MSDNKPIQFSGMYVDRAKLNTYSYTYCPTTLSVYRQERPYYIYDNYPEEFIGTLFRIEDPNLYVYASVIIDNNYYMICKGKRDVITGNTIKFESPIFGPARMIIEEESWCNFMFAVAVAAFVFAGIVFVPK
jgi:hypothetical protein